MKELSVEEKAKAYDDAIDKVAYFIKKHIGFGCMIHPNSSEAKELFNIFPEIKESEDERIKKWIIDDIRYNINNEPLNNSEYKKEAEKAIAWLEKQGKEESIDMSIKEKAHQIAWETSKHYDPLLSKESWCEMAALDMASWLEKQGEPKSYSWKPSEEQFEALDYAYNSCSDTERGNYYEGVLETLIEDLHRLEKQGEQNEKILANSCQTCKAEPKFKVGDWVIKKQNSDIAKFGRFKITDIKDGKYWYTDFIICEITEQDEWETVKVGLKFKVGNWVTDGIFNCKITDVLEDRYIVTTKYEKRSAILFEHESRYHLWTIQDAKDGDVLVADEMIVLFKKRLENDSILTYFHYDTIDDEYEPGACLYYAHIYPATKEQRDQLEKAMADAGYTFDFEKKELKKIEQKPEQKSVKWSEEDKRMYQYVVDDLRFVKEIANDPNYAVSVERVENEIDWMESLKERIGE